LVAGLASIAE